jgi:hypothetical protein
METQSASFTPDPGQVAFLDAYLDKALDERLSKRLRDGLSKDFFGRIKTDFQEELNASLEAFVLRNENRARELSLMERVIRVEEELRSLRELDQIRFDASEKRFEAVDKRFEAVDKRFEELRMDMNSRFDALTKRLDRFMIWSLGLTASATFLIITVLK